jgi:hypothetical protein
VPGGQRYYVDPADGALGFTQAHSAQVPNGSLFNIEHLVHGAFELVGTDGWMACPTNGSTYYKIYAKIENLTFLPSCFGVNIMTNRWVGDGPAAWQYV